MEGVDEKDTHFIGGRKQLVARRIFEDQTDESGDFCMKILNNRLNADTSNGQKWINKLFWGVFGGDAEE